MRPLPRLLAVAGARLLEAADCGIRVAAVAAAGPGVGILVRATDPAERRLHHLTRIRALARPAEAATLAHREPALGRLAGVHGVVLDPDGAVDRARRELGSGWVGVAVGPSALPGTGGRSPGAPGPGNGAPDFVVAGPVYDAGGAPGAGLGWLAGIVALGFPVFATGGITPGRVGPVRDAGAWGVAAAGALWDAPDSARAAETLLAAWVA